MFEAIDNISVEIRYRNDVPAFDERNEPVLVSAYMFCWHLNGKRRIEVIPLDEDIGLAEAHARHWQTAQDRVLQEAEGYDDDACWPCG